MDTGFFESSSSGVASIAWAVATVTVAALLFRYLLATAQLRFQAREAKAVRENAKEAQRRDDRLKSEERSAAITAERERLSNEEDAREAEAERERLAKLHEEAKADVAGNAACADDCKRIIAEADVILVQIARYYTICDEAIDPDEDEPEDPFVNLGELRGKIKESQRQALEYFTDAQDMIEEGLYIVAKRKAENCLIEAKYCADRIINLDTTQWNAIQAKVR